MRLGPAHQVDVAQRPARIGRQRRRPDQAGGAVAQQVGRHDRGDVVDARELGQTARFAQPVARLVEVEPHAVAVQVDDVVGARAVDVGQADAPLVELVGVVEPGRVVHGDLGAEAAIAQVRPVADLAVADAHQVGEAVAAHVGEVDGLRAVGEDQARAALLVQRLADASGPGRSPPRPATGAR